MSERLAEDESTVRWDGDRILITRRTLEDVRKALTEWMQETGAVARYPESDHFEPHNDGVIITGSEWSRENVEAALVLYDSRRNSPAT